MEDEINLLDYWTILIKRKWIIVGITILFSLVALVVSLQQPYLYRATTTIMPVDSSGGGLTAALSVVSFLGGGTGGGDGIERLSPILQSETLSKQVAQALDISKYFPELAGNAKLSETEKIIAVSGILRGAISFTTPAGLYGVTIIWSDPVQAAELANLYVKELANFLNSRSLNINFQVIDPATAPKARFSPKIRTNVMLGAVLGLFSGVFLSFLCEFVGPILKKNI